MSIELGFLWFAELLMVGALVLFVRAYQVRRTNQALHQRLGKTGALVVFVGLLAVEVLARGFGWSFEKRSEFMFRIHVWVASVALVVLIALVWTGIRGPRRVHVRLWPLFFPLYVATVVLSFLAFKLW